MNAGTSRQAQAWAFTAFTFVQAATVAAYLKNLERRRADPTPLPYSVLLPASAPTALLPPLQSPTANAEMQTRSVVVPDTRATSTRELMVGELRRWRVLKSDWDGEGALAPIPASLQLAESFSRHLEDSNLPEPMLHATGRAGFYWKTDAIYADVEFLDAGRIAYYIERSGDKHKGVVNYDANQMPAVLAALLQA
jgi:hypothetical protein